MFQMLIQSKLKQIIILSMILAERFSDDGFVVAINIHYTAFYVRTDALKRHKTSF